MSNENMDLSLTIQGEDKGADALLKRLQGNVKRTQEMVGKLNKSFSKQAQDSLKSFSAIEKKVAELGSKFHADRTKYFKQYEGMVKRGMSLDGERMKLSKEAEKINARLSTNARARLKKDEAATIARLRAVDSVQASYHKEYIKRTHKAQQAVEDLAVAEERLINRRQRMASGGRAPVDMDSHRKSYLREQARIGRLVRNESMNRKDNDAQMKSYQRNKEKIAREFAKSETQRTRRGFQDHHVLARQRYLIKVEKDRKQFRYSLSRNVHKFGHSAHDAIQATSHPFFGSPAFLAMTALTAALVGLKEAIHVGEKVDTAATKYQMFNPFNPNARATESMVQDAKIKAVQMGVAPDVLIDILTKGLRAGLPESLAQAMEDLIPQMAGAMGEPAEKMADNMSEVIQQAWAMKLIKTPDDMRRFLNMNAGMSNFGGNNPQKMDEVWENKGLERGMSLGMSLPEITAFASLINAKGARTGWASARVFESFSENIPKMKDRYMEALHGGYSEQNNAVRSAPQMLGYGNIDNMRASMHGYDGMIEFMKKLGELKPEQRRLIEEGFGFGSNSDPVFTGIAESGNQSDTYIQRSRELYGEKGDGTSYLETRWKTWLTSITKIIEQMMAGVEDIAADIAEGLKTEVLEPLRDFWVQFITDLENNDVKGKIKNVIHSFINGLGFEDMAHMIAAVKDSVGSFDVAGFAKGVGEGLRAIFDALKSFMGVFSGMFGSGDAESIGRLATELFGFALVIHMFEPLFGIIAGLTGLLKAMHYGFSLFGKILGEGGLLASLGKAGELSAGLLRFASAFTILLAAIDQGIKMGWLGLKEDKGLGDFLMRHFNGLLHPFAMPDDNSKGGIQKQSFSGSGIDKSMIQKAAFMSEDTPVGKAILSTDETVRSLLDNARKTSNAITLASYGGTGSMGGVGGSVGASGGAPGSYVRSRGLPDSNGSLGNADDRPTTPLGKTGAAFKGKAPQIMAGLMSRYGLSREQAAGIVGNLAHESGGFTAYHEGGKAPGAGGVGWAQWTGSRRRMFEKWTAAHGLNPTSDEASWRYLTEGDPETKAAIAAVKQQSTAHGAARAFERTFERAGIKAYGSRERFADEANALGPSNGVGTIAGSDAKSVAASVAPSIRKANRGGVTVHAPVHIHDATDPHRVGAAVQKHIDRTIDYRTHDVEFDV